MITISQKDNKLYIGVDYPTPEPTIPDIREGKIYELYEMTFEGPKFIGKYTAISIDDGDSTQIGPLKIGAYLGNYMELEYKGYYQILILTERNIECFDCTPMEEFEEMIEHVLITDDKNFFDEIRNHESIMYHPLIRAYNYVSFIDGVIRVGSHIRRVGNEEIKIAIENNGLYIYTIDITKIPPKETSKTKIIDLPFTIKNGILKKFKIRDRIDLLIKYKDFKMEVSLLRSTGEPVHLKIIRGKKVHDITIFDENITPEIIISLIQTIDEYGLDAFDVIKYMGGVE